MPPPMLSGFLFYMYSTDEVEFPLHTHDYHGQGVIWLKKDIDTTAVGLLIKLAFIHEAYYLNDIIDNIIHHPNFSNDDHEATIRVAVKMHSDGMLNHIYESNKIRANRSAYRKKEEQPFPEILYSEEEGLPKKEKTHSIDHLYVIVNTINKGYKIGRSKNPKKRLATLNISSCEPLELVNYYHNVGYLEPKIHDLFGSKKLNTEWYKLDEKDLLEIDNFINTPK